MVKKKTTKRKPTKRKLTKRKPTKRSQKGDGFVDNVKALLFGRTKLPPNVRKILKAHGDTNIEYFQIGRNELTTATKMAMDAVSFGEFSRKAKKLPYDKLFHLYIIATLENGKNILIEKNDVINMEMKGIRANAESKMVPVNKQLTLNTVMANTKKRMGNSFLRYDSWTSNCQDFILNLLKSNNLGNQTTYKFVKQNTSSIFKGNPIFHGITKFVTDLGAKFDILTKGAGHKSQKGKGIKPLTKQQKEMLKVLLKHLV